MRVRLSIWVLALAAAAAFLIGCGEGSEAETAEAPAEAPLEFHVTLDGRPGPENAGFMLAEAYGYFSDVGLEVIVHFPVLPDRPVEYVAGRNVDVAVSHQPEVVLAQERGEPVTAVAGVISEPTAAMIWPRKSKIEKIADLKGKTIAIPGLPFQKSLLQSLLARAGISPDEVKIETVDFELVPALVSGRADAIFGGSAGVEGVELEARGLEPVVTPVQSLGIPSYEELVLIARPDRLAKDPESIRDFISALARGTAEAIKDPEAAAETIAYRSEQTPNKTLDAKFEATVPLLSESGQMSDEQADRLVEWMYGEGLVKRKPTASELLTNEYLAQP